MEENNIIDLVLSTYLDRGVTFNNLLEEGKIDLGTAVTNVIESGNAQAMYYMAMFVKRAPIDILEKAICNTNEYYTIILFAEYVNGANVCLLLDAAEQRVKELYPEPSDNIRKTWIDEIDTLRFKIVLKNYRAKGIEGVRENMDLLTAITRREETPSLPTR